jgi:hypothetical protein
LYVAALVVILEPWKGPGYTRRNTPFAVGSGGGTRAQGRKISYPVAGEDTDPTSEELQLEEFEYEHSSEEPEDNSTIRQPTPRKNKPLQSSFELEDMASLYGGRERGVQRFSGAAGTIEVEDFKREFTMWCELQKSCNPNFNPYMVWRALFGCLEGAPLADYGEFEAANFTAVVAWRDFYAPNYTDVFGGNPTSTSTLGKGKDKKEEEADMSIAEGQPPPFNPTAEFFLRLFRDYQG